MLNQIKVARINLKKANSMLLDCNFGARSKMPFCSMQKCHSFGNNARTRKMWTINEPKHVTTNKMNYFKLDATCCILPNEISPGLSKCKINWRLHFVSCERCPLFSKYCASAIALHPSRVCFSPRKNIWRCPLFRGSCSLKWRMKQGNSASVLLNVFWIRQWPFNLLDCCNSKPKISCCSAWGVKSRCTSFVKLKIQSYVCMWWLDVRGK